MGRVARCATRPCSFGGRGRGAFEVDLLQALEFFLECADLLLGAAEVLLEAFGDLAEEFGLPLLPFEARLEPVDPVLELRDAAAERAGFLVAFGGLSLAPFELLKEGEDPRGLAAARGCRVEREEAAEQLAGVGGAVDLTAGDGVGQRDAEEGALVAL